MSIEPVGSGLRLMNVLTYMRQSRIGRGKESGPSWILETLAYSGWRYDSMSSSSRSISLGLNIEHYTTHRMHQPRGNSYMAPHSRNTSSPSRNWLMIMILCSNLRPCVFFVWPVHHHQWLQFNVNRGGVRVLPWSVALTKCIITKRNERQWRYNTIQVGQKAWNDWTWGNRE